MKPSSSQRTTQRQLTLESDESQIWGTLETAQQRQLVEHLARLWSHYVTTVQEVVPSNATSFESSSHASSSHS